jgi:hypothetical protein
MLQILLLSLSSCTTQDPELSETVVTEAEINAEGAQPNSNPNEKSPETGDQQDQLDVSTPPWKPNLKEGSKVFEDDLTFQNENNTADPELENSFDSSTGYGKEDPQYEEASAAGNIPTEEITETEQVVRTHIVAVSKLNIRSQPSVNSPVIGVLSKGDAVTVLLQEGNWSRIGPEQYVSSRFLNLN